MAKKFKFKLQALKRFRESRLLNARKDLVAIEGRIYEHTAVAKEARENRAKLATEAFTAAEMALNALLIESESQRIRRADGALKVLLDERERHARWVAHLGMELKAIERLEARQQERHDAEVRFFEKRSMDSWVSERWFHREEAKLGEAS